MKLERLVPDSKYPSQFRLEWNDGVLSQDMYNITWASEHFRNNGKVLEKLLESDPEVANRMPRKRSRKLTGALK